MDGTRTYRNGLLYVMEELNLADFYRLLHPNTKTCTCESKVFVNSFASGTDPTHKIEKPLMSKLSSILFVRALSF